MDENIGATITTLLFILILVLFVWHAAESSCQTLYDVADCEWNFEVVPVIQEESK